MREKYRWWVCAGSALTLFCTSGLAKTGFSVYQPYFIQDAGLSNTQISSVLTLYSISGLLTFIFVIKIYKILELRMSMTLAVVCVAISFFIYSISGNLVGYCVAGALGGFAYCVGGMLAASVLINRWFQEHIGLALGISMASTGLATAVGTPVVVWMVENYSLRTAFRLEGYFILGLAVLIFLLIKSYPEDKKIESDTMGHSGAVKKEQDMYTVSKYKQYIVTGSVLVLGFGSSAPSFLAVLYKGEGYGIESVAFLMSLMGIVLCAGKCIYGMVVDRIGDYRAGNIFYGLLILGLTLFCLCRIRSMALAGVAMILYGLGCATLSVGISLLAKVVSEPEDYAIIARKFQILFLVGGMIFSILPGILADITGSYIPAFILLTVSILAAAIMVQYVVRDAA